MSKDQIYSRLDGHQIRVLIVHPGNFNQQVSCNFETCSLDENPHYDALSYTWGGREPKKITLDDHTWEITANLEQALLHLRHSDETIRLWVDALCINQKDNEEKSRQVRIMGQIYRGAAHVRAWIGLREDGHTTESEDVQYTVASGTHKWDVWKLLEVFGTSRKFDCWDEKVLHKLKEGPATSQMLSYMAESWGDESGREAWRMMAQLLIRPYWNRVWIQQEIHNNPQVSILCGHKSTPLEWWLRVVEAHERLEVQNNYIGGLELPATHFRAASAPTKVCAMRRRFRDRLRSEHHICSLLNDQLSRGVTDPRDKIYGVFDLINE